MHWLPSASAVYGLPSLNDDAKAAVQGWVGALFGEGISDELMQYVRFPLAPSFVLSSR